VIVRTIEKNEISQVAQWNVQLHEDEHSIPMSVDAARQRIRRWLEEGTFEGVIFLLEGQAIGYLLYELRPTHPDQRGGASVYVRQFFIAREARRKGRGTAAFRAFVDELVPSDTHLMLDVKRSNPAAQRFWESLGFQAKSVSYEHDRRSS
jgi:GNAT superfamily N-acetyltransferase